VTRKPVEELDSVDKNAPINDLLNKILKSPHVDYTALADSLQVSEATVKRNIQKPKQQNCIRRVGAKKTGTGKSSNENLENRTHQPQEFPRHAQDSGWREVQVGSGISQR